MRGLADGEFPAGSMGPKIESAERFVTESGGRAVITSPPGDGWHDGRSEATDGTWVVASLAAIARRRFSRRGAAMSWEVRVIRNRYVDSVRLMQVAQAVRGHDGVARAEVAMGTAANLEALAALGCDCASPTDVVIAVAGRRRRRSTRPRRELGGAAAASGRGRGGARASLPRSPRGARRATSR